RQTPQVRVSAFSTSDIISPIPLRPPDWRSEKTITTARAECRKSTEARPQEACPPDVRPAASLPGGLYFRRICVTRAVRQPFLLHGQVAGKTRTARPRGGGGSDRRLARRHARSPAARAFDQRNYRICKRDGSGARVLRPRRAVRELERAVPDQRGAAAPQRQPRAVRAKLPAAVRPDRRR